MKQKREVQVGDHVIYVDENQKWHSALVTAVHGETTHHGTDEEPKVDYPCINLLFVCGDEKRGDQYGRQIDRATSTVHRQNQTAIGFCWFFEDESEEVRKQFANAKGVKK